MDSLKTGSALEFERRSVRFSLGWLCSFSRASSTVIETTCI